MSDSNPADNAPEVYPGMKPPPVHTAERHLSDFARYSKAFGRRLERLELDHAREPVTPEHRIEMREWLARAREHAVDPLAIDTEQLADDRPADYHLLVNLYRQTSELVNDIG